MGKTYIDTVKYVVHADLEIDGVVEKPDVVGAIFGQTEGLLGDELDLRELQKSGRIGRIEVDIKVHAGKSAGKIMLPSSLDRVETAILGAALETVDRVGPCEAKIHVMKIEDTRTMKRDTVVNRAKNILKTMLMDMMPESKEISELVREEVKIAEVNYYGPEKLPCGPNIQEADNVIIVEGRADVLNMLKCDIKNIISLMGKNVPKSVIDLTREKTITIFADGDRGGDLIIKALADLAEVDFVAKAPDGKEVEELTKKEVIKCLRRKIPMDQFMSRTFKDWTAEKKPETFSRPVQRPEMQERTETFEMKPQRPFESGVRQERPVERDFRQERPVERMERPVERKPNPYEPILRALNGSLKGVIVDESMNPLSEVDVKDLTTEMEKQKGAHAVIFDGIITQRLVDIANEKNIKFLVGVKQSKIENKGKVEILTT
jgi:DNA primase